MNTESSTVNSAKKTRYGLDASKYPSRMGQPWNDDELGKLLRSIQKKKTVEEIAKEHERTVGGIHSRINTLAVDYHYNDKRSTEEIQQYTGLTKQQIASAIARHEIKQAIKKTHAEPKANTILEYSTSREAPVTKEGTPRIEPTMAEVLTILKDIQSKLNLLLTTHSP